MNKADELHKLGDVLLLARDFPWNHALYLPKSGELKADTPCLVLDPDLGVDGPDDIPTVLNHNLKYIIDMQSVQGIADNARAQLGNVRLDQLISALKYYLSKDAFIDFRKT